MLFLMVLSWSTTAILVSAAVAALAVLAGVRWVPNNRVGVVEKRFSPSGSVGSGFVALRGQLTRTSARNLFTVQLEGANRDRQPFYARVNVLSDYDGEAWQRGHSGIEESVYLTDFGTVPRTVFATGRAFRAQITISVPAS